MFIIELETNCIFKVGSAQFNENIQLILYSLWKDPESPAMPFIKQLVWTALFQVTKMGLWAPLSPKT